MVWSYKVGSLACNSCAPESNVEAIILGDLSGAGNDGVTPAPSDSTRSCILALKWSFARGVFAPSSSAISNNCFVASTTPLVVASPPETKP